MIDLLESLDSFASCFCLMKSHILVAVVVVVVVVDVDVVVAAAAASDQNHLGRSQKHQPDIQTDFHPNTPYSPTQPEPPVSPKPCLERWPATRPRYTSSAVRRDRVERRDEGEREECRRWYIYLRWKCRIGILMGCWWIGGGGDVVDVVVVAIMIHDKADRTMTAAVRHA